MNNKRNIQSISQLSPLQEGILFEKLRDDDNSSYFIQNAFTLKGKINEVYIRQAISLLSLKYDTLRTAIVIAKSTGKPWQVVLKDREIEVQKEMIKDLSMDKKDELIQSIKTADIKRDFNLERDSLLRVTLIEVSSDEWIILWSSHHILMDGWCNSIIIGDFFRLYEFLDGGLTHNNLKRKVLVEKENVGSYGDFIKWLQNQDQKKAEEYWGDLLVDYDTVAGFIPLENKPAPSEGNCVVHSMTLERSEKVIEFARSNNMTVNRLIETAWGILLQKYNNCDDVVFGKVVSGRNARVKNIEHAIGLFINTNPVRVRCTKDATVLELLKDMDRQAIESQEYDYFALNEIQKQSAIQGQIFDTLFVFENYHISNSVMDTSFDFEIIEESGREETNYDICIAVDVKENIVLDILYDIEKFSVNEIKLILERLDYLLVEMINNPSQTIGRLNLVDDKEKEKVVNQFNHSKSLDQSYSDKTIIEHFENQVDKTPENIALVYEDEELNYRDLNNKANSLAHKLRELGVGRNDIVALLTERSMEMMIGIYGVMKSGGAYGPIDTSSPKQRINFILEDYSPKVILLGKGIEAPEGDYICLDLYSEDTYAGSEENPVKINEKEDLIYLTSTSGTSGKPKSVMIEHAGCTSYVRSFADEFNIDEDTIALQHTAYNFDTIVEEVYPAHIRGGKVVLYNEERIYDLNRACDYMDKHKVSLISCSTLLLKEFNQGRLPKTVNMYLNGGDTLKYSYINNLLKYASVGNTFGSTEETVCAAFYQVPKNLEGTIPAGKPIVGRNVYICQGEQICGIGIPGELCITGSGVSRGYLNREELTKEKFVDNPFGEGKMYKSGDLVRWLPDGNIEFLGRIDQQVKIRGYRVELQEIEEVLNKQAGIKESVVIAKELEEGNQALLAYVVIERKEELEIGNLKEGVRRELPEYMVPPYIMAIDEIPLTVNGKIDKEALPEIQFERQDEYIAPRNSIEKALCKIFEDILGMEQVGIKDNFFELGGDSIKAIRFTTLCRNQNYNISIKDFMEKGTVIELAKFLIDKEQEENYEDEEFTRVPMNPLLNDYVSTKVIDEYNLAQIRLLEVKDLDETLISVLEGMLIRHPMLRVKYINKELKIMENLKLEIPTYDLGRYQEGNELQNQLINICTRVKKSLITMSGLLFEIVYIKTKSKNYILLCGHKLVVDSWSLKLLSEEIRRNYELLYKGKNKLNFIEDNFYLKRLKELGEIDYSPQLDYWSQKSKAVEKGQLKPEENLKKGGFSSTEFAISRKETTVLLNLSESVLGMDIDEVLLANFAIATNKLTNQENVSVTFIDANSNRDKGIGSYEYRYPVVLPSNGSNRVEILCAIKQNLSNIPSNGVGYGWLPLKHNFTENPQPNVLFHGLDKLELEDNYSGNYLNNYQEKVLGDNIAFYPFYKDNKLSFYMEYNESKFSKAMMDKLADYYSSSLISISNDVLKYEKKNLLLSANGIVDAKNLYKEFLEEMDSYGGSIVKENIVGKYEPSLSQQVFLDDTIGGGSSGRFIVEGKYTIHEVEKAILRIISEQSVLRTQYVKKKDLLIENELSMDHKIPVIDISSNNNQKEAQLYSIVEKMGLDTNNLLEGPLLNKICLLKVGENKYVVYIFIHHALWDMTSSSIFERRINQLLKEPDLIHKKKGTHLYSQIIKNAVTEIKSKNIKFSEFINAATNMDLLYGNKSKMTVFKKKFDESIVNNMVMSNQLLATLKLLETILFQEATMNSISKIPVIILHHGRDVTNRRTLGLFQEAKLFTVDINDINRYEKISKILANSPALSLGIKDLTKEQIELLKEKGSKIPSINAVTSYGDDSGIIAESIIENTIKETIGLSSNLPINVRCQFTDDGVVLAATGFKNREAQVLDAMDKIMLEGYMVEKGIEQRV